MRYVPEQTLKPVSTTAVFVRNVRQVSVYARVTA